MAGKKNTSGRRNATQSQSQSQPRARTQTQRGAAKQAPSSRQEATKTPSSSFALKPYPLALQQLILDVFKTALDTPFVLDRQRRGGSGKTREEEEGNIQSPTSAPTQSQSQSQSQTHNRDYDQRQAQPLSVLVQSVKQHLYNRDFDAAFTTADGELLRAYALRWSAGRALGYAGIFGAAWELLEDDKDADRQVSRDKGQQGQVQELAVHAHTRVVCLGGGAGAEIVALAAMWGDRMDEKKKKSSAGDGDGDGDDDSGGDETMSVTAVDIADWSAVVEQLTKTVSASVSDSITSTSTTGTASPDPSSIASQSPSSSSPPLSQSPSGFTVAFKQLDILSQIDETHTEFEALFQHPPNTTETAATQTCLVITLMFTLNELFSTSSAKTSAFLLRLTDFVAPGTLLLVVDSPGSYSTLSLGKSKDNANANGNCNGNGNKNGNAEATEQGKTYPMHYLLDYVLLSVARRSNRNNNNNSNNNAQDGQEKKKDGSSAWAKIVSESSTWFRRDRERLRYIVGDGVGIEDMRLQIHAYRRV